MGRRREPRVLLGEDTPVVLEAVGGGGRPFPIATLGVLEEVAEERLRQDRKWGTGDHHPIAGGPRWLRRLLAAVIRWWVDRQARRGRSTWSAIVLEEVAEFSAEDGDLEAARQEAIQVAAVAAKAAERIREIQRLRRRAVLAGQGVDVNQPPF